MRRPRWQAIAGGQRSIGSAPGRRRSRDTSEGRGRSAAPHRYRNPWQKVDMQIIKIMLFSRQGTRSASARPRRRRASPQYGGCPAAAPVYRWGMPELMLPRLIERAATAVDGSLIGRRPHPDRRPGHRCRAGRRAAVVFGAPTGGQLASRRFRILGERSGREYLSFSLALEDGPESLLEAFGLQLQIALNGLARPPWRSSAASGADGGRPRRRCAGTSSAPARWWTSSQAGACQGGTPVAARARM